MSGSENLDMDSLQILLGERLKTVRKKNNISLTDIEKDYPISRQALARIEKGNGTIRNMLVYMKALKVEDTFFDTFFKNYISRYEIIELGKSIKYE
jgi:transcriptional regulator with XRE-family HTH domain